MAFSKDSRTRAHICESLRVCLSCENLAERICVNVYKRLVSVSMPALIQDVLQMVIKLLELFFHSVTETLLDLRYGLQWAFLFH